MKRETRRAKPWQLRLASIEDEIAKGLADQRMISKNDVVRHALRLLFRLEREREAGGRLMIERPGTNREPVEVWVVW
jgi:hypothetical protein